MECWWICQINDNGQEGNAPRRRRLSVAHRQRRGTRRWLTPAPGCSRLASGLARIWHDAHGGVVSRKSLGG